MIPELTRASSEPAKLVGRAAFDRLELVAIEVTWVSALGDAVLATLDDLLSEMNRLGDEPDEIMLRLGRRAEALMYLQREQIGKVQEGVHTAASGWAL